MCSNNNISFFFSFASEIKMETTYDDEDDDEDNDDDEWEEKQRNEQTKKYYQDKCTICRSRISKPIHVSWFKGAELINCIIINYY